MNEQWVRGCAVAIFRLWGAAVNLHVLLNQSRRRRRRKRDKRRKMTGRAKRKPKSSQVKVLTLTSVEPHHASSKESAGLLDKESRIAWFEWRQSKSMSRSGQKCLARSGQTTTWQQSCDCLPPLCSSFSTVTGSISSPGWTSGALPEHISSY